ncbi:MAG: hypothetical protein ACYSWW_26260, partial [Planctomycetota bacterium]|jgi:hypothetical protein
MRYIHPIALIHALMLIAGLVPFLTGAGLYFSARFNRTTSAVVAGFTLALMLWAVTPALLGLVTVFEHGDFEEAFEAYVSANPAVQAGIIMRGAGGEWNARAKLSQLNYHWDNSDWNKASTTTGVFSVYMLIYLFVGLVFAWRAKCRFRRNIF